MRVASVKYHNSHERLPMPFVLKWSPAPPIEIAGNLNDATESEKSFPPSQSSTGLAEAKLNPALFPGNAHN
jgi:hypothetical protein